MALGNGIKETSDVPGLGWVEMDGESGLSHDLVVKMHWLF